ncbi:MAG: hypothetical protein ACAI44_03425 [Candidatus Sericytochromatia bacterium]
MSSKFVLTALLLCSYLSIAPAQAALQAEAPMTARDLSAVSERKTTPLADDAVILLARDNTKNLDVGDERGIGDNNFMRGKKNNYMRPISNKPSNGLWDLAIGLDVLALLALGFFVLRARRGPTRS